MIEAVNSVIANASLSRGSVEQTSNVVRPKLEAPESPRAPFVSPRIAVNTDVNRAVLQIRDSETGDILTQFPSESRIRAIQAQQALEAAQATRQENLTAVNETTVQAAPAPQAQSFDAGAIATLQAPQGVSTSDIQQATVAFSATQGGASTSGAINVTA